MVSFCDIHHSINKFSRYDIGEGHGLVRVQTIGKGLAVCVKDLAYKATSSSTVFLLPVIAWGILFQRISYWKLQSGPSFQVNFTVYFTHLLLGY